ncbi:MAG: DUF721 domain-containing protein [Candidatus Abyssobacteria bacterium SURF_17]|uniref:DUF721 domain-containing protein n=1 Tax=Candidatus Abyssobacteria bacterium SURF_17 TaxID=2093361 RepID=A0A419EXL3_9BACT|nr:MAG: DUF721 domain-containing protein [Candidatus Abyssubacteria bacterium SURF_17]
MHKSVQRRPGGIESIDRIIHKVFSSGKFAERTHVGQLWAQWKDIVGDDVAQHCVPEKLSDGKLYIRVDSPVWHQQLDLLKEDLKEKIEEKLGGPRIDRIVFRSGLP